MTATISGELKTWHKTTLEFEGPELSEAAETFTDYRLDVKFVHEDGTTLTVPGYFAADGNAAETGATSGNVWHVHFNAPKAGNWRYEVDFQMGENIAADRDLQGTSLAFDGEMGNFNVAPTDKTGDDFRGQGVLRNSDGDRYLDFAETGDAWLKTGVDSPENFLAYEGFDGTVDKKRYAVHEQDWNPGDPTWNGGEGKGIVGAVNYLADRGVNSVYFLTMNVAGDGRDVWPWANPAFDSLKRGQDDTNFRRLVDNSSNLSPEDFATYDVSKLSQWEILFEHMQQQGVSLHIVLQETENDFLLNAGFLGFTDSSELMSVERAVYLREMVARFGHHNAITWNQGEENTNSRAQQAAFADELTGLDAYDHYQALHTFPSQQDKVYQPLLGNPDYDGASVQTERYNQTFAAIDRWVRQSAAAGQQWVVMADETTDPQYGAASDARTPGHNEARSEALWGALMAGGGGIEWYYGYSTKGTDLSLEDFSSRENLYRQSRIAREFFEDHLPFTEMTNDNSLFVRASNDVEGYAFAKEGELYVVYTEDGDREVSVDLRGQTGEFVAYWFDPFEGGQFELASVQNVSGGGVVNFGRAPAGIIDNRLVDGETRGGRELLVEDAVLLVKEVDVDANIAPADVLGGQLAPGDLSGGIGTPSDPPMDPGGGNPGLPPAANLGNYFIVDTATDETLFEIVDGDVLDAAQLAGRTLGLYVEATGGSNIQQVDLSLNGGNQRTEQAAPYSLFGDDNGDFQGGQTFDAGEYEFAATFIHNSGTIVGSESVRFTIAPPAGDGGDPPPTPPTGGGDTAGFSARFGSAPRKVERLSDIDFDATAAFETVVADIQYDAGKGAFYTGGPTDNFAAKFTGDLDIAQGGTYTFYLRSDDGSRLAVGSEILDNDGLHGARERTLQLDLEAGEVPLELLYFERGGRAVLELDWSGPDTNGERVALDATAVTTAADPLAPKSLLLEAEDLLLNGYVVENRGIASGGQVISLLGGDSTGTAAFTFTGVAADYQLRLTYHDESDGQGRIAVRVNGTLADDFSLDGNFLGNSVQDTNRASRMLDGLALAPGDVVEIAGFQGQEEYVRIDTVELLA